MATDTDSLSNRVARLLRQHPPQAGLGLCFEGVTVQVSSNSPAMIDHLHHYYRSFHAGGAHPELEVLVLETPPQPADLPFTPVAPRPGKQVKDEYLDLEDGRLLHKRLTEMQFLFNHELALAVGPCLENANQVINFINSRFVQRKLDEGFLLMHAAAVSRSGRGLAIVGRPGRGKSTLALHVLNHGADFVTNDGLLIRRRRDAIEMLGLPKQPRANPGTLLNNPRLRALLSASTRTRYSRMQPGKLWDVEEKYDVDVDAVYGPGRMRLPAMMDAVLILSWKPHDGSLHFSPIDLARRPDLFAAITKQLTVYYYPAPGASPPDSSPAAYLACLDGCPVFEVTGEVDFEAAAEWCLQQLPS